MRIEEKHFKQIGDSYMYTAYVTNGRKTWFVQARVDYVRIANSFKVKGFECSPIAFPEDVRISDLVEIEHKAQIIDLILTQVRDLAGHNRGLSKYRVDVPVLEG